MMRSRGGGEKPGHFLAEPYRTLVIAHACFLTAILARLFGNLTGESGADSSFG
jgi:hypothetical protein